ncbi:MAG: type II/IV secretion system protein [Candidatus Vogelbacteria bacterium]|nr:type II/IV secretion system protein [Candidatus Vogelbacteria bacterium]
MEISAAELRKLLVEPGLVSAADFAAAAAESEAERQNLWAVLVDKDLIRDGQLGQLVAEAHNFRWLDLRRETVEPAILTQVPELVARRRGVVALSRGPAGIKVGLADPTDLATIHLLEKRLGDRIQPFFITRRDLAEALTNYKGSLKAEFEETLRRVFDERVSREERDNQTIKLVDLLLRYGHQNKASDIHLEPYRDKVLVRFRIDGVLHDVLEVPKTLSDIILTRLKILARMRTDEHRSAQDGKLQFAPPPGAAGREETVDVRVSIVPVTEGENAVLRLLSEQSRQFSLTDLGLGEADLVKVKRAIDNPHGMILVTGPTGSGKTTTVYALVKILNTRDVHISTIEDPVEYDIEGVSQIQVNPKTNLTFASGLRAIVRQDPDIIVVGEIRDEETAGIAVNSAMTGHLVLSTLHANDAATTLPRLLDMGIEPFLVASTVNAVVAQRLVRKVCDRCRISAAPTPESVALIGREPELKRAFKARGYGRLNKLTFYRGAGCDLCSQTGYQGRIGIFEAMTMSDGVKSLVVARASANEITKQARAEGMSTMLDDGLDKVLIGLTTLDEVLRVTKI